MGASKQLVPFSPIVSYLIKLGGDDSTPSELLSDMGLYGRGIVNNATQVALSGRAATKQ